MSAKRGVLVHGVGYKLPARSATHDASTGKRILEVSKDVLDALNLMKSRKWTSKEQYDAARRKVYTSPAIMCCKEELDAFNLVGRPMSYEHKTEETIGNILNYNVVEPSNVLSITGSITDDAWKSRISSGKFPEQQFSINYGFSVDSKGMVTNKKFKELSLVKRGYYDGCEMGIFASETAVHLDGQDDGRMQAEEGFGEGDTFDDDVMIFIKCSLEDETQSCLDDVVAATVDHDNMETESQTTEMNNASETGSNSQTAGFLSPNGGDSKNQSTLPSRPVDEDVVDEGGDRQNDPSAGSQEQRDEDVTMDDVDSLRKRLAEAEEKNNRLHEYVKKSSTELSREALKMAGFDPAQEIEDDKFSKNDARKIAKIIDAATKEDPTMIDTLKGFFASIAEKQSGRSAKQANPHAAKQTIPNVAKQAEAPLKNNGATATQATTKNNTQAKQTPAHEINRPGANLKQSQTMFFKQPSQQSSGQKRTATEVDPLDSIFPDYKRQRAGTDVKSAFNNKFDSNHAGFLDGIKASGRTATTASRQNLTLLNPGAKHFFELEMASQIDKYVKGQQNSSCAFYRSSRNGAMGSVVPDSMAFSVAASKNEDTGFGIDDSEVGRMILPRCVDRQMSGRGCNGYEIAASLSNVFGLPNAENYVNPMIEVGGVIDWGSSMIVGHASDARLFDAYSKNDEFFDEPLRVGRDFAILASDELPCDTVNKQFSNYLADMADAWKHSPVFKDWTENDIKTASILFNSSCMAYQLPVTTA